MATDLNRRIRDRHSPLDTLAMQALRRYGDFNPGTVDGDTILMFIEFANMVLDEIRAHPYWPNDDLPYYEAITDARPVPDPVIIAGLLFHYAVQQQSDKAESYAPLYYKGLNLHLWHQLNGNTPIHLRQVDETATEKFRRPTNPVNGLPE
jgi:hypothetical protein